MVWVTGSFTSQSYPGDKYRLFEPSSSPLCHSQVAPDPPRPQDRAAMWPWMGLRGHEPIKAVQGMITDHFKPSSSPLGHSQVAPDPPRPQDGAARWPWSGIWGHAPPKAVQGMITDHLSHLAAL